MYRNFYMTKVLIVTVIVGLAMPHLKYMNSKAEAKHYGQPYGDIVEQEEELNSFDARTTAKRYEQHTRQRLKTAPDQDSFDSSYAATNLNRKRGQRKNSPYHFLDRTDNRELVASNIVEEQPDNFTEDVNQAATENKCNIWVPMEVLEKYPEAEKKQENKIAGSVYIEVCCKGYAPMRWRGKTLCRPVCENCLNGRCIAPDVCECYEEYVANDNGDCVFTCPLGCLNGRCYLDGSCECDAGFKLDKSRKFCKPICSKGCGNSRLHNCTEPEVCGCIKGYILTDNDCQPVCPHDCGIGGICRQPDSCECNPGYDLKDGVCQADCYQKCDNGICFSRNRCICNPGFTYHERSTQCIPL